MSNREMVRALKAEVRGRPLKKWLDSRVRLNTDSRSVKKGDFFWALKGEQFDGHGFVDGAFKRGCSAVLVEKYWADKNVSENRVYVVVQNSNQSLLRLATTYTGKFSVPRIAVTGSNGKTTVKDMVRLVLSIKGKVCATEKNFNNHIGVPFTLFNMNSKTKFLVAELGTNHPGEIEILAQTVKPHIAVITNIGHSHLEFLKSQSGIFTEKKSIAKGLNRGGTLLVNADDPYLAKIKPSSSIKLLSYGLHRGEMKPTEFGLDSKGRAWFKIGRTVYQLSVLGLHNIYNALAAIAIGNRFKIPAPLMAAALKKYRGAAGRMESLQLKGIQVLNDCYNSSPASAKAALSTLFESKTKGRRIAVLGDMLELGQESERLHREVGKYLSTLALDGVYLFGPLSRHTGKAAISEGNQKSRIHFHQDIEKLRGDLFSYLRSGDILLLKGSRGMKLERLLERNAVA